MEKKRMAGLILVAIVGLLLAVMAGGVFFALRLQHGKSDARAQLAEQMGWTYDSSGGTMHFTLSGETDGVSWEISSGRPAGSLDNSSQVVKTRWRASVPATDQVVFVQPHLSGLVGDKLLNMVAGVKVDVPVERTDLLEPRYTVVVSDPAAARRWLEPVQDKLIDFPGRETPKLIRWRDELLIDSRGSVSDPEILKATVELGVALARSPL